MQCQILGLKHKVHLKGAKFTRQVCFDMSKEQTILQTLIYNRFIEQMKIQNIWISHRFFYHNYKDFLKPAANKNEKALSLNKYMQLATVSRFSHNGKNILHTIVLDHIPYLSEFVTAIKFIKKSRQKHLINLKTNTARHVAHNT